MPQETPERLLLAAVVALNDQSLVTSFVSNQGFAAVPAGAQVVADGTLGISYTHVLILRPIAPASPGNMVVQAAGVIGPLAPPAITLQTAIAGPSGLGAPFAAAVQAASQAGDIAIALPAMGGGGDGQISVVVFQITPAD